MLIKSLYIKNFRQFKGETKAEFSCDKNKNVTVILGNNTFGKTTLLQTFNWCLYDFVNFDKDPNPDFLLNLEIREEMKRGSTENVEVSIVLIHNKTEYIINRSQIYTWNESGVKAAKSKVKMAYKHIAGDGQTDIRVNYIDNAINEILPRELSDFFFFDTERVRDVSNRQDVGEAVKGLLGLTVLDNSMRHIGKRSSKTTLLGKLYNSLDVEGDQRGAEALKKINALSDRRQIIVDQLIAYKGQIEEYEIEKESLDNLLKENLNTKNDQIKKLDCEKVVTSEIKFLEKYRADFCNSFNNGAALYFAKPMMAKAVDFLRDAQIDDKGIKDMTAQSIHEIIKRGKCICGGEIIEGSKEYQNIIKELEFLPPQSIGTTIRNFKETMTNFDNNNKNYFTNLTSRYEYLIRSKLTIQEKNDEIVILSEKILGKEDMQKYEIRINDIKSRLKELTSVKEQLIAEDAITNNEIEKYQKSLDNQLASSERNKLIFSIMEYAELTYDWLYKTYNEEESNIREKLEEKVNYIFNKIYHGKRRVEINEKYNVLLYTQIGDNEIQSGESEGLNRVKNFAFIAGLVELAKEKIKADTGESQIDLSSEPYPLVMDAPFSNADDVHTGNISEILPQVAEQIVMFVMEKDWKYAEPKMGEKVGCKYLLNKKSDTYTILERSM